MALYPGPKGRAGDPASELIVFYGSEKKNDEQHDEQRDQEPKVVMTQVVPLTLDLNGQLSVVRHESRGALKSVAKKEASHSPCGRRSSKWMPWSPG